MCYEERVVRDKAATQFGVMKTLCYPNTAPNNITVPPEKTTRRRTQAETDGWRLTKLDVENYYRNDVEQRFVVILHEITHCNDGTSIGKGYSSHPPSFWEEFQRNFNILIKDTEKNNTVKTLFAGFENSVTPFDWHRAKYRAVQSVMQTDKRSESANERKRKMAISLDYGNYDAFENGDWGLWMTGRNDSRITRDDSTVQINGSTKRFADDFTDEELLEFIDENGGYAPMPVVRITVGSDKSTEELLTVTDGEWKISSICPAASRKALAVQERREHGYTALNEAVLKSQSNLDSFSKALPVNTNKIQIHGDKD